MDTFLLSKLHTASVTLRAATADFPFASEGDYTRWLHGVVARLVRALYDGPAAPIAVAGPQGSGKSLATHVAAQLTGEFLHRWRTGTITPAQDGSHHIMVEHRGRGVGPVPLVAQLWIESLHPSTDEFPPGTLVCHLAPGVGPWPAGEAPPKRASISLLDGRARLRMAPALRDTAVAVAKAMGWQGTYAATVPHVAQAFAKGTV